MKNICAKNHYVPKVYLKSWINDTGKLEVYRTLVPHKNIPPWKLHSPSAIGWQEHLYTKTLAGQESDELEKWFSSKYEYPAQPVIEKVINDQRLTSEDWKILIHFLVVQNIRTPTSLLEFLQGEREILPQLLKKNMEAVAKEIANKKFQEQVPENTDYDDLPLKLSFYPENDRYRVRAKTYSGRQSWLSLMMPFISKHLEILLHRKWTILKPAKEHHFFTSDNPVIKVNYFEGGNYKLVGNLLKPNATIMLPLSPHHIMFTDMQEKYRLLKGTRLSIFQTHEIRKLIATNAHRYIFSQHVDREVEELRPRIVDLDHYRNEKQQIENWHKQNKELELDYDTNKIQVYT
ncbi:MAG: DUF4238 domain-containing protein [bacterium]